MPCATWILKSCPYITRPLITSEILSDHLPVAQIYHKKGEDEKFVLNTCRVVVGETRDPAQKRGKHFNQDEIFSCVNEHNLLEILFLGPIGFDASNFAMHRYKFNRLEARNLREGYNILCGMFQRRFGTTDRRDMSKDRLIRYIEVFAVYRRSKPPASNGNE